MGYRSRLSILVLAAALGLVATEEASAQRRRARRCHDIRVVAAEGPLQGRRSEEVVSAREAQDVLIEVTLPEELARAPVRVKLFTPRGSLYQVLEAGALAGPSAEKGSRRRRTRNGRNLAARLPVAGTQITTHELFGEWRAEVYPEGAETPCGRPVEFSIEP